MTTRVQRLSINYKTLEEFKKFRENGLEELSMLEDLQADLIEDNVDSPFYGIYEEGKLVARISLYPTPAKYDRYFEPATGYLELMKLEVLPGYKGKGYGQALVEYAKSLGRPIKTNVRLGAQDFFLRLGFCAVKYNPERDRGENPYVWQPPSF
ncbi:N-acetyltransferase [Tumebacillus sp. DT12]|uniref:N-acetyltransferase n=1 Tax=Tumebacillus lacus TaxID=2995335 RepID=A0ABT3X6A3_9BACL|nr:N-acetyltransferase [Tumebacillus lacus]MCX7571478.1 N-acetyltransferase [Tumebacillus lacus]